MCIPERSCELLGIFSSQFIDQRTEDGYEDVLVHLCCILSGTLPYVENIPVEVLEGLVRIASAR